MNKKRELIISILLYLIKLFIYLGLGRLITKWLELNETPWGYIIAICVISAVEITWSITRDHLRHRKYLMEIGWIEMGENKIADLLIKYFVKSPVEK